MNKRAREGRRERITTSPLDPLKAKNEISN